MPATQPTFDERFSRTWVVDGPLRGTVIRLALPVLAEQILNSCVGFTDTFLSGRISDTATSAIGVAAYVGWLVSLIFGLVATGTTALVSRHWGARDFDAASTVVHQSFLLATMLGALMFGSMLAIAPVVAGLLGMTGETAEIVTRYLRYDAFGLLFWSWSITGAAALRGIGNMQIPLMIFGVVNVLNITVSTACVYGFGPIPAMGVNGIVVGTVTARVIGGATMLCVVASGRTGLHLPFQFVLSADVVRRVFRVGGPAALDGLATWLGHFLFLRIIAGLSATGFAGSAFAAHVIGIQIESLSYLPAVAWGYAAGTIVGQSLGNGDPERARHAGKVAARQCMLFACITGICFFIFAPQIYSIMHADPGVRAAGVPAFRLMAFFQVPLVALIVYTFALRAAGETRLPLVMTIIGVFGVRLPVGYLCGPVLDGGLFGAWIGMGADVAVRCLLVSWLYFHGDWVRREI